jgi:hypothetical protein
MSIIFESVTTSVSSIKDRREFVTGGKGFVISKKEYITVYKNRKRVRKGS